MTSFRRGGYLVPEFSPATPTPYVQQPEDRLRLLREVLKTQAGQAQRVNIEAVVRMYENWEIGPRRRTDPPIFLIDGVWVDEDPWKSKTVGGCSFCGVV
ncbi:hypothetical protein N7454_006170 [Penicillium verhagenii]|nr:hypothetical protein N7454_006170 [Penicillium verhagenii]